MFATDKCQQGNHKAIKGLFSSMGCVDVLARLCLCIFTNKVKVENVFGPEAPSSLTRVSVWFKFSW